MTQEQDEALARVILQQCTVPSLMTVGAHHFRPVEGGVKFLARIHAFDYRGERELRPRNMTVSILLNSSDYYDIRVTYKGSTGDSLVEILHWEERDLDFTQLHRILMALDYDGPEVLNPRYF